MIDWKPKIKFFRFLSGCVSVFCWLLSATYLWGGRVELSLMWMLISWGFRPTGCACSACLDAYNRDLTESWEKVTS